MKSSRYFKLFHRVIDLFIIGQQFALPGDSFHLKTIFSRVPGTLNEYCFLPPEQFYIPSKTIIIDRITEFEYENNPFQKYFDVEAGQYRFKLLIAFQFDNEEIINALTSDYDVMQLSLSLQRCREYEIKGRLSNYVLFTADREWLKNQTCISKQQEQVTKRQNLVKQRAIEQGKVKRKLLNTGVIKRTSKGPRYDWLIQHWETISSLSTYIDKEPSSDELIRQEAKIVEYFGLTPNQIDIELNGVDEILLPSPYSNRHLFLLFCSDVDFSAFKNGPDTSLCARWFSGFYPFNLRAFLSEAIFEFNNFSQQHYPDPQGVQYLYGIVHFYQILANYAYKNQIRGM